eukprot:UN01883
MTNLAKGSAKIGVEDRRFLSSKIFYVENNYSNLNVTLFYFRSLINFSSSFQFTIILIF